MIELYVDESKYNFFVKGVYHDVEDIHELKAELHSGMMCDSVIIGIPITDSKGKFICTYLLNDDAINFIRVFGVNENKDVPILLHNIGKNKITAYFGKRTYKWTIKPGESKKIIAFSSEGADVEDE